MSAVPLCDLFRRCVARHANAWPEFVRRCERTMRGVVRQAFRRRGFVLGEEELEEALQDYYCRLLTAKRFRGRDELELWAYLVRVAVNLAIDHRRALAADKRQPEKLPARIRPLEVRPVQTPPSVEDVWDGLASSIESPEERLLEKERWRVFFTRCMARSSGRRRMMLQVVRLALVDGWSSREISRFFDGDLSIQQIDSMICRLRQRVAEEGMPVPKRRGGWQFPC